LGLWARGYKSILDEMQTLGFNSLRITFSNQMLLAATVVPTTSVNPALNPDLVGKSPLQCLDAIVAYCGEIGLAVILNRYAAMVDNYEQELLWYVPGSELYSEQAMIADWVMLARRYAGSAVVGMDLWSEPRGSATWATNADTDWNLAAQRIGNAILAVNPQPLIIVEGVSGYFWRGTHLEGVAANPVVLDVPNKVVYGTHEYSCDVFAQPWFDDPTYPNNLYGLWDEYYGYLMREGIAPVMVVGFGFTLENACDDTWLPLWLNYMNGEYVTAGESALQPGELGMSWMFRGVDPYSPVGGILEADWVTQQTVKMQRLSPYLAPQLPSFNAVAGAPSAMPTIQPSIVSSLMPTEVPSIEPTLSPGIALYQTSGNQILARGGAVRFSGINWYVSAVCGASSRP
jgi:endoglucanase